MPMTAQEAKAKMLAVMKEIIEAGFAIGGHWDDEIVLLISDNSFPEAQDEDAYAEITYDDL